MTEIMQVFKSEFQSGKWYAYVASDDDGWYCGPFDSKAEASAYELEDEDEFVARVFQGEDPE